MFLIEMTPETAEAVKIAWWIGIFVALVVTVIDVHLLIRVIRAAKKIDKLADRTLPAAVGIVENTSALKNLTTTNQVAATLVDKATLVVVVAHKINKKLSAVSNFFGGGRK